jgi:hypothetical protein
MPHHTKPQNTKSQNNIPQKPLSIQTIRNQIDSIDNKLLSLIAERSQLIPLVKEIKKKGVKGVSHLIFNLNLMYNIFLISDGTLRAIMCNIPILSIYAYTYLNGIFYL